MAVGAGESHDPRTGAVLVLFARRNGSRVPNSESHPMILSFAGVAAFLITTLYVLKLLLKGNGDSLDNYL